jgi:hypothetical protein
LGQDFLTTWIFYLYLMDEQLHQQASDVAIDWLWILVFLMVNYRISSSIINIDHELEHFFIMRI